MYLYYVRNYKIHITKQRHLFNTSVLAVILLVTSLDLCLFYEIKIKVVYVEFGIQSIT